MKTKNQFDLQEVVRAVSAAQHSKSLRPKQVAEFLGIGLSTVWVWAKRPDFPRARKIGPQVTVWDLHELMAWRESQAQM
jgi:predicted DNA-binding transcriptional regulator AlpA